MRRRDDGLITVLDFGSAKVVALTAEVHEGSLRYRGHGIAEARGVRRGVVSQLDPAAASIKSAVDQAERSAKTMIEDAVAGIGGPHVRGVNSRGGITLGNRLREITREEIAAAIDRARSVDLPPDREILHLLPQEFMLDGQGGIRDPLGMVGCQLEVNLHISTCGASAMQSVVIAANKAHIEISDTVFEGVAAAEATVSGDEREYGCCVVDIGAGSTEVIVFYEGSVAHTAVLPIGGDHFTNDLAMGLRISAAEAEQLKLQYGHVTVTAIPQVNSVELSSEPGREPRVVQQRQIGEILEARAQELARMLRDNLRLGGVLEAIGGGCVFTGGGARLPGLLDTMESILHHSCRIAGAMKISRLPEELHGPEFAATVGLLLYTHRRRTTRSGDGSGIRSRIKSKLLAGIS